MGAWVSTVLCGAPSAAELQTHKLLDDFRVLLGQLDSERAHRAAVIHQLEVLTARLDADSQRTNHILALCGAVQAALHQPAVAAAAPPPGAPDSDSASYDMSMSSNNSVAVDGDGAARFQEGHGSSHPISEKGDGDDIPAAAAAAAAGG